MRKINIAHHSMTNNIYASIFHTRVVTTNVMTNVFPHLYDLYEKRKKTLLLLNNSAFKKYYQI